MKTEPIEYGSSYQSTANLAANTAVAVITPAANVNGAIVRRARISTLVGAGTGWAALVAKSSAPANVADGDLLLSCGSGATSAALNSQAIESPIRIPAGKGLYFIASAAESSGLRSVQYDLL